MYVSVNSGSPEDFLVTEINPDGKLVTLDSYDVPPFPPPPSQAGSQARISRKWAATSSRPDPSDVPPLQDLVKSDKYAALEQLSRVYKETLVFDPDVQLDLGRPI